MATGPDYIGQMNQMGQLGQTAPFGAPGTSGSLASVFSDQAKLYQMQRLEDEQLAEEKRASQMGAIKSVGETAIKQAEWAGKSRDLQQAKLADMQAQGVSGADQFQNIQMDPNASIWEKAKATFNPQGVEAIPGNDYTSLSPAAKELGFSATPATKALSGGDLADSLDDLYNPPPAGVSTGSQTAATGAQTAATGAKSAMATGMNIAGGAAGVAGAAAGAQKIAQSETGKGKAGGALQVAGGLGAAGVAAGLLSGPVGWASLGASLLGGFLND